MELINVKEAKEYVGLDHLSDKSFLRHYCYGKNARIASIKIGKKRQFRKKDLDEFMKLNYKTTPHQRDAPGNAFRKFIDAFW